MKIAVDFDGTIVKHEFPRIGDPVPEAIEWLKMWKEAGAQLILWTMRSDCDECLYLTEAIEYCRTRGIEFDAVNEGLNDRSWTTSPKAYANIYVDDAAFGCPLIEPGDGDSFRPYVNWGTVGPAVFSELCQLMEVAE